MIIRENGHAHSHQVERQDEKIKQGRPITSQLLVTPWTAFDLPSQLPNSTQAFERPIKFRVLHQWQRRVATGREKEIAPAENTVIAKRDLEKINRVVA
jgi:hypothetical protein